MKQGRRQANNRLGQGGVLTTFGSVCSGIEAASVAWHPLGWKAAWLSEIEPFPCAVLAHHYPDVPNLGDMTTLTGRIASGEVEAPDVFTGGTPCQAFSVAGKRGSLADVRGNLSLTFCEIADAIDDVRADAGREPSVIVWENVPGVLSTTDNAFGCFLGALAGAGCELQPAGGRWTNAGVVLGPRRAVAWRVLDAQYFGLAQRRRRVFVVASARDGFDPAAVLFEFDGVRRDSAPSREAGERPAPTISARTQGGGGLGTDFDLDGGVIRWPAEIACTLNASFGDKQGLEDQHVNGGGRHLSLPDIAGCLQERDAKGSDSDTKPGHLIPVIGGGFDVAHREIAPTLTSNYGKQPDSSDTSAGPMLVPVAFAIQAGALRTNPNSGPDGVGVQADHAYTLEARAEVQAVAIRTAQTGSNGWGVNTEGTAYTLDRAQGQAVAFQPGNLARGAGSQPSAEVFPTLKSDHGRGLSDQQPHVAQSMQVRRLTPVECERLQGFPDGWTAIPYRKKPASECHDGPRYKALGNSWAVPVVRWIGRRIQEAIA